MDLIDCAATRAPLSLLAIDSIHQHNYIHRWGFLGWVGGWVGGVVTR
jgi:hypothetical protein